MDNFQADKSLAHGFPQPVDNSLFKFCTRLSTGSYVILMQKGGEHMADRNTGFIKIDRNIVRWRWYKNHQTFHVFISLLLMANYKDADFERDTIHRGQLATSLESLSNSTSLTISQVRTALSHLKETGEIAITRRSRYLVITVLNYSKYQDIDNQMTIKSHSNRNQIAFKSQQSKNSKEYKEGKERKNNSRSAPDSPSAKKQMPDIEHGTVDDIPEAYRDTFSNYADYWRSKNQ